MKKISIFVLGICACFFLSIGATIGYAAVANNQKTTSDMTVENVNQTTVFIGDEINVESKTLHYGDLTKEATIKIISPDGQCFGGNRFAATTAGVYTVEYSAYFEQNGKLNEVVEKSEYLCIRKSTDFFDYNDSVVASYGDYRHNTARVQHKGVYFDVKSGAEITCNALIDVSDLNLDNPLIDFIVDPTEIGVNDFTDLKIRIQDAYDENSYVDIFVVDGGFINQEGASICARAGFNGGIAAGYEEWVDQYITTITGTSLMSSFHGYPVYEPTYTAKFYLDYNSKTVYGKAAAWTYDQLIYINDLTNKRLYKFNPWEGFTSNKVKISLYPSGFNNVSGRLLIKSIAGIDFSEEIKEDTTAPTIQIDYGNQRADNLPDAVVGKPYKIFPAIVDDDYDVNLAADVSVTYYDSINDKRIDVSISDGQFIPKKSGIYTISYDAVDNSGNKAENLKVKIYTSDYIPMTVTCNKTVVDAEVYSLVEIPSKDDLDVQGSTGEFVIERKIFTPSGNEITVDGNSFIPYESGDYRVSFTLKDYIGETVVYDFILNVKTLSKPVFTEDAVVPPVLISGYEYSLNAPSVVDLDNEKIVTHKSAILINGKESDGRFIATGKQVIVEFVYNGNVGNVDPIIYNVPVVDVKNTTDQAAYFCGTLNAQENIDEVALSTVKDGVSVFASKLGASDLSINFTITDKNNFGYFTIKLVDAADPNVSLTFKIDLNGKKFFYLKDSASFAVEKGYFNFKYKNYTKRVSDILGNEIAECNSDDNGNVFNGFSDGVYVTFGFEKVSGASEVLITKICNQPLGTKERSNPTDNGDPIIEIDGDVKSEQYIGDNFEYPSFKAYDVLGQITVTSIEIKTPSNKTYTSGMFKITEYGRYKIYYYAEDSFGNFAKIPKTVFVNDDSAPEVTITSSLKDKYSIGDVVSVPDYSATDNLGEVIADVILILPDNQARLLYHDENGKREYYLNDGKLYSDTFIVDGKSFRVEQKGEYRIRYVVYDKQCNTTVKEVKFIVE